MNRLFLVIVLSVFPTICMAADQLPRTFKCTFSKGVFTSNSVSNPDDFKSEETEDTLELVFDSIDLKHGTARLVGNAGATDIVLLSGGESLHLLELTRSGNLNLTTIYLKAMASGGLFSVQSRHTGFAETPTISQYWGRCKKFD